MRETMETLDEELIKEYTKEALIQEQIEREKGFINAGVARAHKNKEKSFSDCSATTYVMSHAIPYVSAELKARYEETHIGRAIVAGNAFKNLVDALDKDYNLIAALLIQSSIAFLTSPSLIRKTKYKNNVQAFSRYIISDLIDEVYANLLDSADKYVLQRALTQAKTFREDLTEELKKELRRLEVSDSKLNLVDEITSDIRSENSLDKIGSSLFVMLSTFKISIEDEEGEIITEPLIVMYKPFVKSEILLRLSDAFLSFIEKQTDKYGMKAPVNMPSIAPLKDWTSVNQGGYLTIQDSLVRTKNKDQIRAIDTLIENKRLHKTLHTVNTLQKTGWRVNAVMAKILREKIADTTKRDIIVKADNVEIDEPSLDCKFAYKQEDSEDIIYMNKKLSKEEKESLKNDGYIRSANDDNAEAKSWRAYASSIVATNKGSIFSSRLRLNAFEDFINEMEDFKEFYYRIGLDFRARLYYENCRGVNPQGDDLGKALIEFSEGERLGPRGTTKGDAGYKWLCIDIANNHGEDGIDKALYADRVKWVEDNIEKILEVCENPHNNGMVLAAGKKTRWQFIAACHELKGYLADPENFMTHRAINVDGTCNGSQHFAAMLREEKDALLVAMFPQKSEKDLYETVSIKVQEKVNLKISFIEENLKAFNKLKGRYSRGLKADFMSTFAPQDYDLLVELVGKHKLKFATIKDFQEDFENLNKFVDNSLTNLKMLIDTEQINRTICKRPAMTKAYSVTLLGVVDQTEDLLRERLTDKKIVIDKMTIRPISVLVGRFIFDAVSEVIPGIQRGQDFFTSCAKAVNESGGKDIIILSPTNFPMYQSSRLQDKDKRVQVKSAGKTIRLFFKGESNESVDKRGQVSGISPQIIHLYDAAALTNTVYTLSTSFLLESFSMIHDSYGVHACHVDLLQTVLRYEFVEIYETNQLEHIKGCVNNQIMMNNSQTTLESGKVIETEKHQVTTDTEDLLGSFDISSVIDAPYFFS